MGDWAAPTTPPASVDAPGADWRLPSGQTVPELLTTLQRCITDPARSWADVVTVVDLGRVVDTVNASTAAAVLLERVVREIHHCDRYASRLARYRNNGVIPAALTGLAALVAEEATVANRRSRLQQLSRDIDAWVRINHRVITESSAKISAGLDAIAVADWSSSGRPVVASWWPLGGALRPSDAALMDPVEWQQFAVTLMGRAVEYGRESVVNHPSVQEELGARRGAARVPVDVLDVMNHTPHCTPAATHGSVGERRWR